MSYKVGDRVKIRDVPIDGVPFNSDVELYFEKHPDRILTIKRVKDSDHYYMEEIEYLWDHHFIEYLYTEAPVEVSEPIHSRFEILDIQDEI